MLRLLIAANFHLDQPLPGYSSGARQQRRKESLTSFNMVVNEAVKRQVDGVIVAGNLFHTPYPSPPAWEAVKTASVTLKNAGIPLLLLSGEYDEGPFYQNVTSGENFQFLSRGMSKEFISGITVSNGTEVPDGGGILYWRGADPPNVSEEEGALTIIPGPHWKKDDHNNMLTPGAPLKLNFDEPDDPSVTLVTWDHGPSLLEQILLPDRVFATVRWDVEERGVDFSSYLQERMDNNLALRLLVFGEIEEAFSVDELERQYQSSFFHLSIIDQTTLSLKALSSSPLVNDTFNQLVGDALSSPSCSPDEAKKYFRAWVLGQNAFKGGEKRAN